MGRITPPWDGANCRYFDSNTIPSRVIDDGTWVVFGILILVFRS